MKPGQSLYSIIQFRPDEARAEGVNVGVVVACPSKNVVRATFSSNNVAVKKRFGADLFDDARLTSAKRALKNRIERAEPTEAALRTFIAQEAGTLVLLEPRPIVISDLDADLAALFDELVGELQPSHRARRPAAPQLGSYFDSLEMAGVPIDRDVSVSLPGIPTELHFPFGFRNGVRNLIKPQGFALDTEDAFQEAKELAADGQLLAKHPDPADKQDRKLIVVAAITNRDLVPSMKNLFKDFDARLFVEEEIQELLAEIRNTAHR
jgi:hypothetical protein